MLSSIYSFFTRESNPLDRLKKINANTKYPLSNLPFPSAFQDFVENTDMVCPIIIDRTGHCLDKANLEKYDFINPYNRQNMILFPDNFSMGDKFNFDLHALKSALEDKPTPEEKEHLNTALALLEEQLIDKIKTHIVEKEYDFRYRVLRRERDAERSEEAQEQIQHKMDLLKQELQIRQKQPIKTNQINQSLKKEYCIVYYLQTQMDYVFNRFIQSQLNIYDLYYHRSAHEKEFAKLRREFQDFPDAVVENLIDDQRRTLLRDELKKFIYDTGEIIYFSASTNEDDEKDDEIKQVLKKPLFLYLQTLHGPRNLNDEIQMILARLPKKKFEQGKSQKDLAAELLKQFELQAKVEYRQECIASVTRSTMKPQFGMFTLKFVTEQIKEEHKTSSIQLRFGSDDPD